MSTQKKLDIKLDYTYVEEVFDSKDDYKNFLQIMCFEFEEAIEKLVVSIEKEDIISYRKTLHNIVPHLDMLRANAFSHFLEHLKTQVGSDFVAEHEKNDMINDIKYNFEKIIQHVSQKHEQICAS